MLHYVYVDPKGKRRQTREGGSARMAANFSHTVHAVEGAWVVMSAGRITSLMKCCTETM